MIDMDAQLVAAFMVLMFVAAYAAAENYVRRAHAADTARIIRVRRGESVAWYGATKRDGRPEPRLMSFPTASGPCR
jgi:hypothetical protein